MFKRALVWRQNIHRSTLCLTNVLHHITVHYALISQLFCDIWFKKTTFSILQIMKLSRQSGLGLLGLILFVVDLEMYSMYARN